MGALAAVLVVGAIGVWGSGDDSEQITVVDRSTTTGIPDTTGEPDTELLDYRAAVGETVRCLEDLGYQTTGPWPHPDGRQYKYDYTPPESGETPALRAAADQCYEQREQDAQATMALRAEPSAELQADVLEVIACLRSRLTALVGTNPSSLPSTVDELENLEPLKQTQLDAAFSEVLHGLGEGSDGLDCVASAIEIGA